ncbi:MAG TPA: aspartyl protease family protein [Bryobacteraceae bacterium]|nr:aspartyl protease family protein [Bryobacteraceae bacterium]
MLRLVFFFSACVLTAMAAELPETLLRSGQVDEALVAALAMERAEPGRADVAVLLGNIYLRKAELQEAERHFQIALALDPNCAQAYLGLGRLDQMQFRRKSARDRFAKAYALCPLDAGVVRAYASVASDAREEVALLKTYLAVGAREPREELEAALGHLEFHRRLGERRVGILASPYRRYRLKLESWSPRPGRSQGLLLAISINGSRPLKLVLDTGADGIFVHAKAASKLGLEYLSAAAARGAGEGGPAEATRTLAAKVQAGAVEWRNCVVDVIAKPVSPEVDGVIGASVFRQFLLELDPQREFLELVPYPDGAPPAMAHENMWADRDRTLPAGSRQWIPVCQTGHLLLVNTTLADGAAGYLVLDTGAAFTSVSHRLARATGRPMNLAMAGAGGALGPVRRAGAVRLRIGNREVVDADAILFDFRPVSNQEGLEISGLIGYPVLSRGPLTIDYRDGLVGFDFSR